MSSSASSSPSNSSRLGPEEWLTRVRSAKAGAELLGFISERITRPYEEGPLLDDRHGESPVDVFENLAKEDLEFRARLDETAREYFLSDASNPTDQLAVPLLRGLLDLVQRKALTGANSAVRGWFRRHHGVLVAEEGGYLARAVLGALATSQTSGIADMGDFWMQVWREAPPAWQPRAFIGLRIQNPKVAAAEIPELIKRTQARGSDPGALLHGLWNQPGGREALLRWLNTYGDKSVMYSLLEALRGRLDDDVFALLSKQIAQKTRRARPPLYSLAPSQPGSWF